MKTTGKMRLFLLCGGVLLASFALYADAIKPSFLASSKPIIFSSVEGKQWVERC